MHPMDPLDYFELEEYPQVSDISLVVKGIYNQTNITHCFYSTLYHIFTQPNIIYLLDMGSVSDSVCVCVCVCVCASFQRFCLMIDLRC